MITVKPPRDKQKAIRIKCLGCEAVMLCTEKDLRFESDQRGGDAYVMLCPHCEQERWITTRAFE